MLFFDDALDPRTSSLWSDRKLRAILEDLLRIRRDAEAGHPPSLHDAYLAASKCARLVEALLSCIAAKLEIRVSCEEWSRLPYEERRALLVRTLGLGLPVLQPKADVELSLALDAANAGPARRYCRRRWAGGGVLRSLAAYTELELLKMDPLATRPWS